MEGEYKKYLPNQQQRSLVQSVKSVAITKKLGKKSLAGTIRRSYCHNHGRFHWDQCLVGVDICYQCKGYGHCKRECP